MFLFLLFISLSSLGTAYSFSIPSLRHQHRGPQKEFLKYPKNVVSLASQLEDNVISQKSINWKDSKLILDKEGKERNAIVIIAGFEAFNLQLYKKAGDQVTSSSGVPVFVFTDVDIQERPEEVEGILYQKPNHFVNSY